GARRGRGGGGVRRGLRPLRRPLLLLRRLRRPHRGGRHPCADAVRRAAIPRALAQLRALPAADTVGYFWTAWAVLGLDPARWSLAQIGFHVVNALLVCAIASQLLGSRPAGLAAALVYASAPGHALAVRWSAFFTITGTTLVYFLGLWAWLRAAERWRVPATLAIFVIGLMCSEHAVSFPAALTAIAVLGQGRRDGRGLARELAPFWLVGRRYGGAKLFFLRVLAPRLNPLQARLFRVAYALSFDPLPALDRLGRYVAAVAPPLYAPEHSATWYRGAGALTVGL